MHVHELACMRLSTSGADVRGAGPPMAQGMRVSANSCSSRSWRQGAPAAAAAAAALAVPLATGAAAGRAGWGGGATGSGSGSAASAGGGVALACRCAAAAAASRSICGILPWPCRAGASA